MAADLRAVVQQRRASFWHPLHAHGYAALEQAVELRELLASAELTVDSVAGGVSRYVGSWWRIDLAYRRCTWNLRRYGQVQVMEQITQWVEKSYVNNFLLPLTDRWSDQVRGLATWECPGLPAQRKFFENYVQPFLTKGQKVFVIVSDALRYEAAADYAQRLRLANRWTAEVEALFGVLPSYTQLGMAARLPGNERPATKRLRVKRWYRSAPPANWMGREDGAGSSPLGPRCERPAPAPAKMNGACARQVTPAPTARSIPGTERLAAYVPPFYPAA